MEISVDRPKAGTCNRVSLFYAEKGSQVSHYRDLERNWLQTRSSLQCPRVGEIQIVTDKMMLTD